MKLWFKFSGGLLFGLALYAVSPPGFFGEAGALRIASTLAARLGSFVLLPLLCVNIALSLVKFEEDREGAKVPVRAALFHLVSLFVASILGIAAALVANPEKIAPLAASGSGEPIKVASILTQILPERIGSLFDGSLSLTLPLCLFSFAIGLAMAHDPAAAKPVSTLLDSASRVFHTASSFITEILGALLIPLGATTIHDLAAVAGAAGLAYPAFLAISTAAVALVVAPAAIFFLAGKANPLPLLYSSLPGAIAGGGSANLAFASGTILRQARENLGVKRRYHTTILATGFFLGRAGTAFVSSQAAVAILASHSPLALTPANLILVALLVPLATILGSLSLSAGPIACLGYFTFLFGRGYENGHLAMLPLAFPLAVAAAFLDALWLGLAQGLAGGKKIPREPKNPMHFI